MLFLLALPAMAQAQYTYTTNLPDTNTITITDYTGPGGDVVIPSNILGKTVTIIGDEVFMSCSNLTDVTIPDSITTIGRYAFRYCSSLTHITIPDSVTSIGSFAFNSCSSLTNATIGDGVTDIGSSMFGSCSSLTHITIPDSVTNIEHWAFGHCTRLTNVSIGSHVTAIGDSAFYHCVVLMSVTLPDSVTTIEGGAFEYCSSLTNLFIGNSVTDIGDRAFISCSSLTEIAVSDSNSAYSSSNGVLFNKDHTILIQCPGGKAGNYAVPDSVTNIGDRAFGDCSSLTEIAVSESNSAYSSSTGVLFNKDQTALIQCPGGKTGNYTVPDSVINIGDRAFASCTSLTLITIPDSVTMIGDYAFLYCTSLPLITIPESITNIGGAAFGECPSLASVYFMGNAPSVSFVVFEDSDSTIYHLPGATGWPTVPDLWADRPTAFWLPEAQADGMGVQSNEFGFTVSWASGQTVVVEANADMTTTNWVPIATNTITNGTFYFSDSDWTNYPGRFYRQRSQ